MVLKFVSKKIDLRKNLIFFSFVLVLTMIPALFLINNKVNDNQLQSQICIDDLARTQNELNKIKNQDQVKINQELTSEINAINATFKSAVSSYEEILDRSDTSAQLDELEELFAKSLTLLSDQKYEEAKIIISEIDSIIKEEEAKLAAVAISTPPPNTPINNTPPGSGYSRQSVTTDAGTFTVDIIAADISSTKVIVDTASASDCANDCPVLSLSDYVSRNGAYAGVNGSYFCPSSYPSCAGKTNSFDTLLMNKDKTYFNSSNNVYSNNPAVIFGGSYVRFVGAASQWGRDTGIDSMISNYPLLVSGGNVVFGGDDDPKKGSRGNRSFVANKGNTVYIGVVRSATVAESALVLKSMSMENALNLDNGGSTALWSGGYKVGPGRNIPNAILFVAK